MTKLLQKIHISPVYVHLFQIEEMKFQKMILIKQYTKKELDSEKNCFKKEFIHINYIKSKVNLLIVP